MKKNRERFVLFGFILMELFFSGVIIANILRGKPMLEDWKWWVFAGGLLFVYILYLKVLTQNVERHVVDEKIRSHTLVESLPGGVWILNAEGETLLANQKACELLGESQIDVPGKPARVILEPDGLKRIEDRFAGSFKTSTLKGRSLRLKTAPLSGEMGMIVLLEPDQSGTLVMKHPQGDLGTRMIEKLVAESCWLTERMGDEKTNSGEVAQRLQAALLRVRLGLLIPGTENGDRKPTDLGLLAQQAVSALKPVAERAGVTLAVEGASECLLCLDGLRIQSCFEELLSNAIRFSKKEATVTLEIIWDGSDARIRVTDTGIGIDSEHFAHIFDLGFQVNPELDQKNGGTGFGLYAVKKIVESYTGNLWVESQPGRGTRMTLHLPEK